MPKVHLQKKKNQSLCGIQGIVTGNRNWVTCLRCRAHPLFSLYSLTDEDCKKLNRIIFEKGEK